jgi:hypothetical protein
MSRRISLAFALVLCVAIATVLHHGRIQALLVTPSSPSADLTFGDIAQTRPPDASHPTSYAEVTNQYQQAGVLVSSFYDALPSYTASPGTFLSTMQFSPPTGTPSSTAFPYVTNTTGAPWVTMYKNITGQDLASMNILSNYYPPNGSTLVMRIQFVNPQTGQPMPAKVSSVSLSLLSNDDIILLYNAAGTEIGFAQSPSTTVAGKPYTVSFPSYGTLPANQEVSSIFIFPYNTTAVSWAAYGVLGISDLSFTLD